MDIINNSEVLKRQVTQISKEGVIIKKWSGIREVTKSLKIPSSRIIDCCKFRRRSAGGFFWSYNEIFNFDPSYGPLPRESDYFDFKGCAVFHFRINGDIIDNYTNSVLAALETDLSPDSINIACISGILLRGAKWSYYADGSYRGIPHKYDLSNPFIKSQFPESPTIKTNVPKTVNQFTKEGEYLKSFPSIRQAAKELGLKSNSLSLCCNGKQKTCGGFRFEFEPVARPEKIISTPKKETEEEKDYLVSLY